MRPQPYTDDAEKRNAVLQAELAQQSDRGAAIVATAWLDDYLTIALTSCLIDHQDSWKRLLGPGGSLDTLSAKIDLITLLGVVSSGIRSDFHTIREIRNEFAHHVAHKRVHEELNFDSPHIRDKCMSLRCVNELDGAVPRQRFIQACLKLSKELELIWMFDTKVHDLGFIHLPGESAA